LERGLEEPSDMARVRLPYVSKVVDPVAPGAMIQSRLLTARLEWGNLLLVRAGLSMEDRTEGFGKDYCSPGLSDSWKVLLVGRI
jgi:hypothetical protein